jgi:putative tricarboxylic transport membrane protein
MLRPFWKSDLDFFSGLLLLGIAGVALWYISGLEIGTAREMKTGFFPFGIALVLAAMGAILVMRGLFIRGPRMELPFLRPLTLVLASAAAFAFFVDRLGLVVAVLAQVTIAGFAPQKASPLESLLVGLGLALFCMILFVWLLGLPMKILPW